MRILFIGDIVGKPGRRSVAYWTPKLVAEHAVDAVIANAENSAGGLGVTPEIVQELQAVGVQGFTLGNHTWRKRAIMPAMDGIPSMVRPANYPEGVPGRGSTVIELDDGRKLGLLNLIGRVYMEPFECPFARADKELAGLRAETKTILVDSHCEATSEKIALGWHLDGRCSAVVGTHTHVQTADEWILPGGTAYITDVGMCGPMYSVIGTKIEAVVQKFRTGLPRPFEVANGPALFSAVLIDTDDNTGKATAITRILKREDGPPPSN